MKITTRKGRNSTSFSPPETHHKIKEDDLHHRRSLNLETGQQNADETLFKSLMSNPSKRAMLLKILSQEKNNIEKYKRDEERRKLAKVGSTERRFIKYQRLLHCESPTALMRRRALGRTTPRRDSSSSCSSDSKSVRASPVPYHQLLKGVVAYVEVRSKDGDRSAGAKALMQTMGATVVDNFSREVTHVLFKDGSFDTYQRAKLKKVHLVSVLWLEAVRKQNARVPEKKYPALGTEAYDANISAICEDYEEVVHDEYRRSLALQASSSTAKFSKGRKTALPYDLLLHHHNSPGNSNSSGTSFHTAERVSIVPSSQDWEAESVISCENTYPPFRKPVPTLIEEDGGRLGSPDFTSDSDSDCGVIDGHSVRDIRDSLLDDLDLGTENFDQQNEELLPEGDCREPANITGNTSSSQSVSLLSRKSFPNRKSSHSIVDMDLTNNVVAQDESADLEHSDKENSESRRQRLFNVTKRRKQVLSSDRCNVVERNIAADSVQKTTAKKRNTIGCANDLKSKETGGSKKASVSSTNRTTLPTTGSSVTEIFKRPTRKSLRLGDDIPSVENSSDNSKNEESHSRASKVQNLRKKISLNSGDLLLSNQNNRETIQVPQNLQNVVKSSLSSEDMSPLRISAESTADLENIRKLSATTVVLERRQTSSGSETMPSLRISADSSKSKASTGSRSQSCSRKSIKCTEVSDKNSENTSNDRLNCLNGQNVCEKTSLNSEDMPVLRISTESLTKSSPSLTKKNSTGLEEVAKRRSLIENNSDNAAISPNSPNLRVVLNKIITSLESPKSTTPTAEKGGNGSVLGKRRKQQQDQEKTVEGKKKLRKLFNPNQSVSSTMQNWNLRNADNKNNPSTSVVVNEPMFTKTLVVPLTPLILTHNARKFLKSQKTKQLSKTEPKTMKTVLEKLRKPVKKHVKKLYADGDRDEQKELANEYVKAVNGEDKAPKRKSANEEGSPSPKKLAKDKQLMKQGENCQTAKIPETLRRRSQRLSLCEKTQEKGDSTSSNSKIPIQPELKRRSTLDFVQTPKKKVQKLLSQKGRKVRTSIVCTRMHKPEVQDFIQIVRKLGDFYVEDEVSGKTTHLVVGEPKRTINLLRAIARGCWILTKEWLYKSLEFGKWLPEDEFELIDFSPSVQQCRMERQAFGRLFSMDIFENCGPIYIARSSIPRCSDLEELVKLCKGSITRLTYKANIVVGDWVNYDKVTCLTEKWILDSITLNKRKSFSNYIIKQRDQK